MEKFVNWVRSISVMSNNSKFYHSIGEVTGYDPNTHSVTVQIFPETDDSPAQQTGWIPLQEFGSSDSGLFSPPKIGDQISVHYQEGSLQNCVAGGRVFNNENLPPNVPSGETWIIQGGSYIKMKSNGDIEINSTGNVTINSSSVKIGNGTFKKLINENFQNVFNTHTHGGGSPPDSPMPSNNLTAQTEAS